MMRTRRLSGIARWLARRAGWWLCWCTLAAGSAIAETPPTCPPAPRPYTEAERQAAESSAPDRGLLWRIERDGRVSYLYGTVHVARRAWVVPGPQVRAALQASDLAAFELDLLDPAVLDRLQRAAQASPHGMRLPSQEARQIARAARLACVQHRLDGLRPELQVITLVSLSLRLDGLDPAWGIDGWLARLAHARRQTVLSLETPEQQVALLVAPRPAEVATVVRRGLDELEDPATRRVALRLAEHWAASDLAAIENFAQWCGCLESEAERQAHQAGVLARNPAMAERIATLHQRGARVFAAVGALHMTGPEGLPALLARRGFQVELLLPKAGRH